MTRVVIVGAGIVGAACAFFATRAGLDVVVIDRGQPGSGTTSRGEGNLLVSDKAPGPELDLMRFSRSRWLGIGAELGRATIELEEKGGLVVATTAAAVEPLMEFARGQALAGVRAEECSDLRTLEPHLSPALPAGICYPEDMQVQPVLAAVAMLTSAIRRGATFRTDTEATGVQTDQSGTVTGLLTNRGAIGADIIINAAGTWGGVVSEVLGAPIPVAPRRGFVLVTEPMPKVVNHKVYSADYIANVASSGAGLETSCVVEGTQGGTILIGASRERVGFDTTLRPEIVADLARQAIGLFPMLARVNLLRVYRGFRPYCPDHLPVIGSDSRVPGVYHACGHEGAGIGLSPATGYAITEQVLGRDPQAATGVDFARLSPDRFVDYAGGEYPRRVVA